MSQSKDFHLTAGLLTCDLEISWFLSTFKLKYVSSLPVGLHLTRTSTGAPETQLSTSQLVTHVCGRHHYLLTLLSPQLMVLSKA